MAASPLDIFPNINRIGASSLCLNRHFIQSELILRSTIDKILIPTLIVHGKVDEVVPYWHGAELYAKAARGYKVYQSSFDGSLNPSKRISQCVADTHAICPPSVNTVAKPGICWTQQHRVGFFQRPLQLSWRVFTISRITGRADQRRLRGRARVKKKIQGSCRLHCRVPVPHPKRAWGRAVGEIVPTPRVYKQTTLFSSCCYDAL